MKIAIVVAEFNPEITHGLLSGAQNFFKEEKGISISSDDILYAPGAFEIPLIAKKLAETGRFDGIVCLGAVIKGDTAHFEFISLGATYGLMQSMLLTGVPISFGVLTTYNDEQAQLRSQSGKENKGREAAEALWKSISILKKITTP